MEGRPTESEKIFINCVFDKRLVFRIYKELLKFDSKKTTQFKTDFSRSFSKEDTQMAHKHIKIRSMSIVIIRGIQMEEHNEIPLHTH